MIPEGRQLDDIADVKTNDVTQGIFALISPATCVKLDGNEELRDGRRPASRRRVPGRRRRWRYRLGARAGQGDGQRSPSASRV